MSGAKSYEPFLCVERAELARLVGDEAIRQRELREAHRLFTRSAPRSVPSRWQKSSPRDLYSLRLRREIQVLETAPLEVFRPTASCGSAQPRARAMARGTRLKRRHHGAWLVLWLVTAAHANPLPVVLPPALALVGAPSDRFPLWRGLRGSWDARVAERGHTCRKYVVPLLQQAGWDTDPHSIKEQRSFTDGRIVPKGNSARRGPGKRADYLLRHTRLSASLINLESFTPKASAICAATSTVGQRSPRSSIPMYVRCTPAACASASWDNPLRFR
jgi:hypothetical protein